MSRRRQFPTAVLLALAAALSGYGVWQLRDREQPPPLVGPPRSDYLVERFELLVFDEQGKESFFMNGPRMARHPHLGSIEIEQPRMRMPGEDRAWQGRADRGWVSPEGDRVRLSGAVELRGDDPARRVPLRVRSAELELLPRENKVSSEATVTVTGPGSILRGRGLRADLDTRRFELLSEVSGRYESILP